MINNSLDGIKYFQDLSPFSPNEPFFSEIVSIIHFGTGQVWPVLRHPVTKHIVYLVGNQK
jgi:hypothetical protein